MIATLNGRGPNYTTVIHWVVDFQMRKPNKPYPSLRENIEMKKIDPDQRWRGGRDEKD